MKLLAVILMMAGLITITGCHDKTEKAPPGSVWSDPVISSVSLSRRDHVRLSQGRELIVTSAQTPFMYLFAETKGVEFAYELTQPDGKYIYFDCENVADKVIDRDLVPEVEHWCGIARANALYFWEKTPPSEFTDGTGVKWRKVQ